MKIKTPRILVGCPVSDYHKYCTEEFIESIKNLTYKNYDILLVDNSKDEGFFNSIKNKVPAIRGEHYPDVYDRITHSRNLLRQKALEGGYDYFLSIEQDVIPPKNVIERLLAYKKDIITGVYFKPWEDGSDKEPVAMIWVKHPSKSNRMVPVRGDITKGNNLLKIDFCGLGCILIHRRVLEKVKFRYDRQKCEGTDDIFFCADARKEGFEIYADTAVKCKHMVIDRPWQWRDIISEWV